MAKYESKNKRRRRIGNRLTDKLLLVLLLTVILLVSTVGGVSARYVHRREAQGLVKAKEFYFTSNYLVPGEMPYTLNPGNNTVTIELRNYDGLKISELDVNYSLKVNGAEKATGTLAANAENTAYVQLTNLAPGTYTVTATGQNGYMRELSATFEVKGTTTGIFKHTENCGDYVILTIWTQGVAKDATVTVPAGLTPDRTDSRLRSVNGSFPVSLGRDESQSYRFFVTGAYGSTVPVTADGAGLNDTALN